VDKALALAKPWTPQERASIEFTRVELKIGAGDLRGAVAAAERTGDERLRAATYVQIAAVLGWISRSKDAGLRARAVREAHQALRMQLSGSQRIQLPRDRRVLVRP
jgi:hypothetical protein